MTVLILRKTSRRPRSLAGFLMQRSWTDGGALGVFGSAQDDNIFKQNWDKA
ncbi:hypothetical protein [Epilithonimonas caeni]|uniref:hypothetical protein n=1 Tax=Epilithonimonas caeni TaxID=365343 RepID=UPI0003F8E692|nr:hypothetical protein [Epilithonimonas caeni]